MSASIITPEDLKQFKDELLAEIKLLLEGQVAPPNKRWLKSYEVLTMLDISKNTLQTMRNTSKG